MILLAPACRCSDSADLLAQHGAAIDRLRIFAMRDAAEQQDRLVPIVYPRSLLYFVSGVAEGDVDMPILGMERYLAGTAVFDPTRFPEIQALRSYLAAGPRKVWSIVAGGPGLNSAAVSHGDFAWRDSRRSAALVALWPGTSEGPSHRQAFNRRGNSRI